MELLFTFTLLLAAAPAFLIAGLLVKLTLRGPILYSQVRVGLNGRPSGFSSSAQWSTSAKASPAVRWCVPGDPRITPVGLLLRKTHMDELPQLWNVVRGEMSLIGPRPERPEFFPELEQAFPHYRLRLPVRPGLSGWPRCSCRPIQTWRACAASLLATCITCDVGVVGWTRGLWSARHSALSASPIRFSAGCSAFPVWKQLS